MTIPLRYSITEALDVLGIVMLTRNDGLQRIGQSRAHSTMVRGFGGGKLEFEIPVYFSAGEAVEGFRHPEEAMEIPAVDLRSPY